MSHPANGLGPEACTTLVVVYVFAPAGAPNGASARTAIAVVPSLATTRWKRWTRRITHPRASDVRRHYRPRREGLSKRRSERLAPPPPDPISFADADDGLRPDGRGGRQPGPRAAWRRVAGVRAGGAAGRRRAARDRRVRRDHGVRLSATGIENRAMRRDRGRPVRPGHDG